MEVSEGELMQLVSGRKRPAISNAFKHERLNIDDLLGPAGFDSAVPRRIRILLSTFDYKSQMTEQPGSQIRLSSFGIKTVNEQSQFPVSAFLMPHSGIRRAHGSKLGPDRQVMY